MINKYTAFIVEDEKSNLELLKYFIEKFCLNISIIGEAMDVNNAIDSIAMLKPDILFLDIKLNERDSFEILDMIDFSEMEIVFITAYEEFALKAFRYNAIDYILKPLSIEDLILATNKAIQRIEDKISFEKEINKIHKINVAKESKFITISSLDKTNIIKRSDILFCKSDGRYTTFFLSNKTEIVACKNLGEFEDILAGDSFFRIHHSYIVNIDFVANINKKAGNYCEMTNGALLLIAKRRQENLNKFLKIKE